MGGSRASTTTTSVVVRAGVFTLNSQTQKKAFLPKETQQPSCTCVLGLLTIVVHVLLFTCSLMIRSPSLSLDDRVLCCCSTTRTLPPCSKIFIGGLSFETTDEALKRYFEQFGPVADAIVMKDAVSRRSRGFGFITYMNSASVDAALSVKQHVVDNRRVEAKRAVPRSEVPIKVIVLFSTSHFVPGII